MPFNFPDSPTEGQFFTPPGGPIYKFLSGVWKASFPDADAMAYIPEAPVDGNVYGRSNATWIQMAGGTGDNTPVATVIWTARTTPPTGYLKANGALVSRTTYANLFAAIGTLYGAGDGSTTFKLPDLRGEFIRGFDDARGVDSGRAMGSSQAQAMESHTHTFTGTAMATHNHTPVTCGTESADHTHTFSDSSSTTGTGSANHTHAASAGSYMVWTGSGGSFTVPGGAAGTTGSTQASGASHTHTVAVSGTTSGRSAAHTHVITPTAVSAGTPAGTNSNYPASGAETRPRNVALLACIKY